MIDLVAALAVRLTLESVSAEQLVAGAPRTGYTALGEFNGAEYGVWEMTPGAMSDVEEDELFIVVAGEATVEFVDDGRVIPLSAGSVCRLEKGDKTIWRVVVTLRKVYLT